MNEFTREVHQTTKTYREITRVRATDAVAGQYAPYVGGTPNRMARPPITVVSSAMSPANSAQGSLPLLPSAPNLEEAEMTEDTDTLPASASAVLTPSDDRTLALQFFEDSGNQELTNTEVDFKGTTKKDQLVRFVVIYAWSYVHILGTPVPTTEHFAAAAKRAGLHDANYSKHFPPTAQQYLLLSEGTYKTKPAGTKFAKSIIEDMQNPNLKGLVYWQGSTKSARRPNRVNRSEQEQVESWVSMNADIGSVDVRTLKPTQQAMLALWLLTKQLNVASAMKPRLAFEYLSKKFTTISGKAEAFTKALGRRSKFFGKTADGLYYLHEIGEKEVEAWLKGVVPVSETDDVDDRNSVNISEDTGGIGAEESEN